MKAVKLQDEKILVEKYEEYKCGCFSGFKVKEGRCDGLNFICYDHGGLTPIPKKRKSR